MCFLKSEFVFKGPALPCLLSSRDHVRQADSLNNQITLFPTFDVFYFKNSISPAHNAIKGQNLS